MTDPAYVQQILNSVADQLLELLRQLKEEEESFADMGIDYEEKAFYDILVAVAEKFQFDFPESENIELAKEIRAALRDKEKYADWANSAQIKALMQADIIIILAKHGYPPTPPEIYEKVYNDILEQAENFKKYSDDTSWEPYENPVPNCHKDIIIYDFAVPDQLKSAAEPSKYDTRDG